MEKSETVRTSVGAEIWFFGSLPSLLSEQQQQRLQGCVFVIRRAPNGGFFFRGEKYNLYVLTHKSCEVVASRPVGMCHDSSMFHRNDDSYLLLFLIPNVLHNLHITF